MSEPIIKVENLSKKYQIGHKQAYYSLRDEISSFFQFEKKDKKEEFWALKDVNFEVKQEESVGIIGRNGAGKSTLLKVLSQITPPTTGKITMKGRVASLLEVGTGFNPELTGRENIFLNGAILGMTREEIKRKFDEIVAFAEIEKFLDTPVKRYSSGMYMRLAFSVAAHLESEILIVDEVLAVGDAQFQKKCLGKMNDVTKNEGRTVLFVSHNMGAISSMCSRSFLFEKGKILSYGDTEKVISKYINSNSTNEWSTSNFSKRGGSGGAKIMKVWQTDKKNEEISFVRDNEGFNLNALIEFDEKYYSKSNIIVGFGIDDNKGNRIATCVSSWKDFDIRLVDKKLSISCFLNELPLINGKYLISVSVSYGNETLDYLEHCGAFNIENNDVSFSRGRDISHGILNIKYNFKQNNV